MSKNILVYVQVPDQNKLGGCEYYRQELPHQILKKKYGYTFRFTNTLKTLEDSFIMGFDAVHIIRKDNLEQIERIRNLGVPVIFDIDDYWKLYGNHALHNYYKRVKMTDNVVRCLKHASVITTTTPELADKIKEFRDDVVIIPNCLTYLDKQFTLKPKPLGNKIRLGWIGGTHHLEDLQVIRDAMQLVWQDNEINDKIELVIGGYQKDSAIHKHFVKILSGNLNKVAMENIMLLPAMDVFKFANMYDECDVMLAPLKDNDFNRCKSELKVIEAGWKGKMVIASNVAPYSKFENVILCDERKVTKQFYKAIKNLVLNPDSIIDYQEKLNKEVVEKYDIEKHIWKLHEIYQTTKF